MINLVIAHSQQRGNVCKDGDVEQTHMFPIAQELFNILKVDKQFNLFLIPNINLRSDRLNLLESVKQSNDFIKKVGGKGYHLELHSDAFNGKGFGATGIYKTPADKLFCEPIYNAIKTLTPWEDRGMSLRTDLWAFNGTKATARALIEISFHDEKKQADWMHKNVKVIARALADGLYKALKIKKGVK